MSAFIPILNPEEGRKSFKDYGFGMLKLYTASTQLVIQYIWYKSYHLSKYSLSPEIKKITYGLSHAIKTDPNIGISSSDRIYNDSIIDNIYNDIKKFCIDLLKLPKNNKLRELIGPSTFIDSDGISRSYSQWFSCKYCNLSYIDKTNFEKKCNYLEKNYTKTLNDCTLLNCVRQLHFRIYHLRKNIQNITSHNDKYYLMISDLENRISDIKNKILNMEHKISTPQKNSYKRKFVSEINLHPQQDSCNKFIGIKNSNKIINKRNISNSDIVLNQSKKYRSNDDPYNITKLFQEPHEQSISFQKQYDLHQKSNKTTNLETYCSNEPFQTFGFPQMNFDDKFINVNDLQGSNENNSFTNVNSSELNRDSNFMNQQNIVYTDLHNIHQNDMILPQPNHPTNLQNINPHNRSIKIFGKLIFID